MASLLEQLKSMTTIVADTGDIEAIRHHHPQDATTNPSLLLKAATLPEYVPLIVESIAWAKSQSSDRTQQAIDAMDKLAVNVGLEVLKSIPGRISTEVDSRLSFDTEATLRKARKLIGLYNAAGVKNDRVLIKIASTWEGIRAAEILEREGINCNLTLMFGFAQARACAEAGVTLISPFVGRILDWHKARSGRDFLAEEDPGVLSVRQIYAYYKAHGHKTIVMGASFRNMGEIVALAGCDRLTIAPPLLKELDAAQGQLARRLTDPGASEQRPARITEAEYRWDMNEDAMATEKLAEGIRGFTVDQIKLEKVLAEKL
jgi:transaldolase